MEIEEQQYCRIMSEMSYTFCQNNINYCCIVFGKGGNQQLLIFKILEYDMMYQLVVYKGKTKKSQELKLKYEFYKTIHSILFMVINLYNDNVM